MELACVLLDVGGTLWPDHFPVVDPDIRTERLRSALPGISASQAVAVLDNLRRMAPAAESGLTQDVHKLMADITHGAGLDCLEGHQLDAVRAALCLPVDRHFLFRGTHTLVRTISRLGLRCAVVSNASVRTGQDYRQDFARFGLSKHIQSFVSSTDVGIRKPDPQIFRIALRHLECAAERAVVIGNSEINDIQPGRGIGARTVRVGIEEPLPAHSDADVVATRLVDVAKLLTTWAD